MSEREAMALKVVAYHNEQARGASFEWHARCATHVENQEQIIKALADAAEEMNGAIILLIDGDKRAVDAIAQSAGRLTEALRIAGRLP